MSGSVRIYLRGHFQCSPDDFQAQMCDVDVSSDTLLSRINEGYAVIGAVAQTFNAKELAATDSQQLKAKIRSLLARHDGYRSNDGEKAPGWLLHELRELSAV